MAFDPHIFISQFADTIQYWWVIIPAIFLGIIVGAIPGFSAANTIIILLPLALNLPVEVGFIAMIAIYCASHLGAGAPAILVNIPGTAGAAATPLDGYPDGAPGARPAGARDLVHAPRPSAGCSPPSSRCSPCRGSPRSRSTSIRVEMIVVMLFGISLIATIAARDTMKGLVAGFFGLMIGCIGADHVYETPRGTFGFLELYDGVPLIPALVGPVRDLRGVHPDRPRVRS